MTLFAIDFDPPRPRLSAAQLAAVSLAHAGGLALLLASPTVPVPTTLPHTLTVSLIAPDTETPRPEPQPRPVVAQATPVTPRPLLAAIRNTPTPEAQTVAQPAVVQPEPVADAPPSPPTPAPVAEAPKVAAPVPQSPPRPADYLTNPTPPYPSLSRRRGEQGTVHLNVLVNPDGSVARLEVARSSGHARLDTSAAETVQTLWKFEPARQGDKPVAAWVVVPIQFILRS